MMAMSLSALAIVIGARALTPVPGWPRTPATCAAAGSTDLLRAAPFDRVTLIDGTDLLVDPVSPRPLPAPDPSKESKRRERNRKPVIPPEGNISRTNRRRSRCPGSEKEVGPDG